MRKNRNRWGLRRRKQKEEDAFFAAFFGHCSRWYGMSLYGMISICIKEHYGAELFVVFTSHCCVLIEGENLSAIRHWLSVRTSWVSWFSSLKDFQQRSWTRSRAMADTHQERAVEKDLMSYLARFDCSIMTRERRITTRLSNKNMREPSLSEWPSLCRV